MFHVDCQYRSYRDQILVAMYKEEYFRNQCFSLGIGIFLDPKLFILRLAEMQIMYVCMCMYTTRTQT